MSQPPARPRATKQSHLTAGGFAFSNTPRKEHYMSKKLRDFISIARLYRHHHSAAYAARIAHGIACQGLPF